MSYLAGLAGHENGERNALATAEMFNKINPYIISVVSLTVFPDTALYQDVKDGKYIEADKHERLKEIRTLISNLKVNTHFFANTISNPVPLTGYLPKDTQILVKELDSIIGQVDEKSLKTYREIIKSL